MLRIVPSLVLVAIMVSGGCRGQDASTVSPQDIFDLSEDDFKLWISGREPKAWDSGSSPTSNPLTSSSRTTTITTPNNPPTTMASVFRTTSPLPPTFPDSFLTPTTTTTVRPTVSSSEVKSWFEEETGDGTPRTDQLGEQFKPAGEDFAQWLERQMNRVQEVTFIPQTTLAGDQQPGAGLVTRLTTIRNRIPVTTYRPALEEVAPVTPPSRPTPPPPPPPRATGSTAPTIQGPLDLQQWLRDQLQTSQRLTDRLLAQWAPSGAVIRADGQHFTPNAVSYQTSALIHGLQGVSHSSHIHSSTPHTPLRRVFHPAGSFYYSHPQAPQAPQYGSFVGHYRAPLYINYN